MLATCAEIIVSRWVGILWTITHWLDIVASSGGGGESICLVYGVVCTDFPSHIPVVERGPAWAARTKPSPPTLSLSLSSLPRYFLFSISSSNDQRFKCCFFWSNRCIFKRLHTAKLYPGPQGIIGLNIIEVGRMRARNNVTLHYKGVADAAKSEY